MKNQLLSYLAALLLLFSVSPLILYGQTSPELIYYQYDESGATVTNRALTPVGSNPAAITSATQGGVGQFGGAFQGTGTGYTNTGYNTNLGSSDWTISFWIDFASTASVFQYFFGDAGSSAFRCFANGAAGVGNIVLRGPITDVLATGVADGNPHVVHFVKNSTAGTITSWVDGVLNTTTVQSPAIPAGTGMWVGGYSAGTPYLQSGAKMDEFRLYDRALDANEIATTWDKKLPLGSGPNDAGATRIVNPQGACAGEYEVSAEIANFGNNLINSVIVEWSINGVSQIPVTLSMPLDTLLGAGVNSRIVALGNVTLTAGLTDEIKVWTTMPNNVADTSNDNDTTMKIYAGIFPTVESFPYYEDFEAGQADWLSSGTNSSWAFGTPGTANISGAASGINSFVTNLTGDYNTNESSMVESPCFDFTNFEGEPWVALDVNWHSEENWDGAVLQVSTDGGISWNNVGKLNDPYNWYNEASLDGRPGGSNDGWAGRANLSSGGWVRAKHVLDASLVGTTPRFRVAFGSDGSVQSDGFAFDNFTIVDYKHADLGPDVLSLCGGNLLTLDPHVNFNGFIAWSTLDSSSQMLPVSTAGTYYVHYTDSMIDVTSGDTIEIIQSPAPVIKFEKVIDTIPLTSQVTLDPNLPYNLKYTWTPTGNNFPYLLVKGSDYGVGSHLFTLHVEDSVACSDDKTTTVVIMDVTGTEEFATANVVFYPNPVKDKLNVKLNDFAADELFIYNITGQVVHAETVVNRSAIELDIENYQPGMYLMLLKSTDKSIVHQFIKE